MGEFVFCVPMMERAVEHGLAHFPSGDTAFALDFNPNNAEARTPPAAGADIRFDADGLSEHAVLLLEWLDDAAAASSIHMTFAAVWLYNWKECIGDGNVLVESFTSVGYADGQTFVDMDAADITGPLLATTAAPTAFTHRRFWRFQFNGSWSNYPEIAMVVVGRRYRLNARWSWMSPDSHAFFNTVRELDSGRWLSKNLNTRGVDMKVLQFDLVDDTDMAAIRGAFRDARGRHGTIIVGERDAGAGLLASPRLMRFAVDDLQEVQVQNGLWRVTVPLVGVPWIEWPYPY